MTTNHEKLLNDTVFCKVLAEYGDLIIAASNVFRRSNIVRDNRYDLSDVLNDVAKIKAYSEEVLRRGQFVVNDKVLIELDETNFD